MSQTFLNINVMTCWVLLKSSVAFLVLICCQQAVSLVRFRLPYVAMDVIPIQISKSLLCYSGHRCANLGGSPHHSAVLKAFAMPPQVSSTCLQLGDELETAYTDLKDLSPTPCYVASALQLPGAPFPGLLARKQRLVFFCCHILPAVGSISWTKW